MEEDTPSQRTMTAIRWWEPFLVVAVLGLIYLPYMGSYGLWDPWEGHYAEVARRMLAEGDFLFMRWMHEVFHSKPPLPFWLMAGSMSLHGVAEGGGFSGEMVSGPLVEWSVRLPFVLLGITSLGFMWAALARLVSRRLACLAVGVVATTPYFFFISRQAITDMPMCALLVISASLFLLTIHEDPEAPIKRWFGGRVTAFHLFLAVFALVVVGQLGYFAINLWGAKVRLSGRKYFPAPVLMVPFLLAWAGTAWWAWKGTRTNGQVRMYWFYLLAGVSVLAKGPLAPALLGLTIFAYLALTAEWKLLKRVEIPRGVLIALLVGLPWHFAMFGKDGNSWAREYLNQHLLQRAFSGVHGDRGPFLYFVEQLGYGMWPWIAVVPVALAALVLTTRIRSASVADRVRLYFGIWAIVGFFFFSIVETKFHHYILPAVPALGVVVAFWLDDLVAGRVRWVGAALAVVLALFVLTSLDLVPEQQQLFRLFIYRYDRSIPRQAPWSLDFTWHLAAFAAAFAVGFALLLWARARRFVVWGVIGTAVAFTYFCLDVLQVESSPHFSQRGQHAYYYKYREIRGVELVYRGLRELYRDLGSDRPLEVRSLIPVTLKVGAPMRVQWEAAGEEGVLEGTVSRIDADDHRFWIQIPEAARAGIAAILDRARTTKDRPRPRELYVDGDRVIATLYWRGEGFYSGGEMYEPGRPDRQTAFHEFNDTDSAKVKAYIARHQGDGRRFWLITETGRIPKLKALLPAAAQGTFRRVEEMSAFFGTATWQM